MDSEPKLLITAYPVRGLDIGASYKIYDLLLEQKQKGVAVLFIGEDLDILLEICDRIAIIYDGMVTGIVKTDGTTKEEVGILMSGGTMDDVEKYRAENKIIENKTIENKTIENKTIENKTIENKAIESHTAGKVKEGQND